ncbi:hypothetical protein Scep_026337 [Stephania cephalantha]|uniref:DUF4283 domain-containing protein n=1 Tax=Stephania cephalantha TaxID=152367 RepID=A0AAP0ES75_9MAGN
MEELCNMEAAANNDTKKVKFRDGPPPEEGESTSMEDLQTDQGPKTAGADADMQESSDQQDYGYKDRLMQNKLKERIQLISLEEGDVTFEEDEHGEPWKYVVVDRSIGYKTLTDKINELWKPLGDYRVLDMENQFYLIQLSNKGDMMEAHLGRPWVIMGHCLFVQAYSPDFNLVTTLMNKITIWVRFSDIPVRHWYDSYLMKVGKVAGKPLKVDYTTLLARKGSAFHIYASVVAMYAIMRWLVRSKPGMQRRYTNPKMAREGDSLRWPLDLGSKFSRKKISTVKGVMRRSPKEMMNVGQTIGPKAPTWPRTVNLTFKPKPIKENIRAKESLVDINNTISKAPPSDGPSFDLDMGVVQSLPP